jgi:hypothetical protein
MNKEELIAEYDEMKKTALAEYLRNISIEIQRYKKVKETMKEWYDNHKAKL